VQAVSAEQANSIETSKNEVFAENYVIQILNDPKTIPVTSHTQISGNWPTGTIPTDDIIWRVAPAH